MNKCLLVILTGVMAAMWSASSYAADREVTIGTAGVTGVYYPAGGAICRLVNRNKKEHGIHCNAVSSKGSVNNLEALDRRELDFAVVQSDWQFFATQNPTLSKSTLRSVFSLYTEPFTIMVRASSNIQSWDDLRGKRVNIGPKESGVWRTLDAVLAAKKMKKSDFQKVSHLRWEDQARMLCNSEVDAIMMTIGHPNANLQSVVRQCDVRLIGLDDATISALVKQHPYLVRAAVQGGMYPGNPMAVPTIGVKATLVTHAEQDEKVVYEVTRAMLNNLDNFRTLHPVFANLDEKEMFSEGLTATLHSGALRYFRDEKLLPPVRGQK